MTDTIYAPSDTIYALRVDTRKHYANMKEDILCLREMGTGRKWCAQPFPENEKAGLWFLKNEALLSKTQ